MSINNEEYLKVNILNLELSKYVDKMNDKCIEIYEPTSSTKRVIDPVDNREKQKRVKNYHGLQSPFFGINWEEASTGNQFQEVYSCSCGAIQGAMLEDEICPYCKDPVKFVDIDIEKTGWMTLEKYKIIHPVCYIKLQSLIGKDPLRTMLKQLPKDTKSGTKIEVHKRVPDEWVCIGIDGFRQNFIEILTYFSKFKKNKTKEFEEMLNYYNNGIVFTNTIPVINSVLRPHVEGELLRFDELSKKYEPLRGVICSLNDRFRDTTTLTKDNIRDINRRLYSIQRRYMGLYDVIFSMINGKESHIRSQLIGGRINFSARNVIVSDETLRANEIKLSYNTAVELYRYELIAHISTLEKISISKAEEIIKWAKINYSSKIHGLLKYMVSKYDYRVLINRNPTINHGSILLMKLKDVVYTNSDDYTMSVPIQSLNPTNGDFDGDIINIVSLKTKSLIQAFIKFDPTEAMFLSNNDGKFNPDFGLIKDQIIGLYAFNTF